MYSGIAMYDTENISPKIACDLGERFFKKIGIGITGAGYYSFLENGDHVGDHDIIDISFLDLKKKIELNAVTAFRIYCEEKGVKPWVASFGYTTNDFGGFYYVDVQFPDSDFNSRCLVDFFKSLGGFSFSYGIGYGSDSVTKSFYYATGDNMINLYPYENASLFKRECPGRFKGQERYKNSMLRMVYPVNVINENHRSIIINGVSLYEWIFSNEKYGVVESLDNGMWLWMVQESNLDEVNDVLGKAGVLISWKSSSAKKVPRKLP
ncbi:hypothetical protein L2164_13450 [Pectobacterium brasiliense]|uniref:Uncharacterized protein n=1 Tax=Pectobacterium odoriferum TaxID=78398 RepID=A0ABR4VVF9_9GAMM|nr:MULTISPECIES: hypothetical protein [Pectobacterium]KGA43386.1 hypothetical protein KU75_01370 [Pectobacterium odoriferum]MCG5049702.1 hypothetical protein [Pectobacterium brasiliense]